MTACRALWALMYAGVSDVRLLDGQFNEWKQSGGEIFDQPSEPEMSNTTLNFQVQPKLLATTEDVQKIVDKKAPGTMMDIRRYSEHAGTFNDYQFFDDVGHIPNAVWPGNWVELLDLNTGKLKDLDEIEQLWKSLGVT